MPFSTISNGGHCLNVYDICFDSEKAGLIANKKTAITMLTHNPILCLFIVNSFFKILKFSF